MRLLVSAIFCVLLAVSAHGEVYFEERFVGKSSLDSWFSPVSDVERQYGKFVLKDRPEGDGESMGLKTSENFRSYVLSKKFPAAVSTRNKRTVIQLSVRFEQDIDCGGGYIKILDSSVDPKNFNNESSYRIMFGPDVCGSQKRVIHAIFEHKGAHYQNKVKELNCKDDEFSHVYTLILDEPNKKYVIKLDGIVLRESDIEEDYEFLAPKQIKDPKASKPVNWDDREMIDDPEDKKPEDWDKPEFVKDDKAEKPDDWNDEVDGDWEAPTIPNPEFKGPWTPRSIPNPDYKGLWVHPMIDNPDYVSDPSIGVYDDLGLVGFELWQVKAGTVFGDLLITDDEKYAEKRAEEILDMADKEKAVKKEKQKNESPKLDEIVDEDDADETSNNADELGSLDKDEDEAADADDLKSNLHEEL